MKYIIEHLDPKLFEWCIIEYKFISGFIGKEDVIFTNLGPTMQKKLSGLGECHRQSVKEMNLKNACVLDPTAEKTLSPKDNFDYLIFGGILGDNPPKARTQEALPLPGIQRRNIGLKQFPTDNAMFVCKKIVEGTPFSKFKFVEELEIEIEKGESVNLPFRYVMIDDKPLISDELVNYIREHCGFD
jgi:ribosome biogenesis SPOUT family RNA methylase Rps3